MINLYEYISSYDIIDDISHPYTIISDVKPIRNIPNHITFHTFSEAIKNNIALSGNVLAIAHHLTSEDIIRIDQFFSFSPTWINLNPGVMSMIYKNDPETNDIIQALGKHYQVIEPISISHLLQSLQPHTYMRVHNTFLPESLPSYTRENGITKINDSDSMADYIILTTPSTINEVMTTTHILDQTGDFSAHVYIQHTFSTILNTQLIQDIQRTKHIIIILDHRATEEIWMYYDTLIKQQTGDNTIAIQYIFPQFHLVSSILSDYIYEEAQFDQKAFINYLSQHE